MLDDDATVRDLLAQPDPRVWVTLSGTYSLLFFRLFVLLLLAANTHILDKPLNSSAERDQQRASNDGARGRGGNNNNNNNNSGGRGRGDGNSNYNNINNNSGGGRGRGRGDGDHNSGGRGRGRDDSNASGGRGRGDGRWRDSKDGIRDEKVLNASP